MPQSTASGLHLCVGLQSGTLCKQGKQQFTCMCIFPAYVITDYQCRAICLHHIYLRVEQMNG